MKKLILAAILILPSVSFADEQKVTIEQLYQLKGQLLTNMEIEQNQLKQINDAIAQYLESQKQAKQKPPEKKDK